MNKRLTLIAALAALTGLTGASAWALGMQNSKHDFVATDTGVPIAGVTEMCRTCHWPHRPIQNVPLWSHTLSGGTFQMYNTNATYSGLNTARYDASPNSFTGSASRACLSCHDGTVAVAGATFISNASVNWMLYDGGVPVAGGAGSTGLKGSHPVGVTYAGILPAADYNAIPAADPVQLENGKVQCTSCHNAHLMTYTKFLVKSNAASAICTTCHNK